MKFLRNEKIDYTVDFPMTVEKKLEYLLRRRLRNNAAISYFSTTRSDYVKSN